MADGAGIGNGKKSIQEIQLSTEERRNMVNWMYKENDYPIQQGCELMGQSPSTIYYHSQKPDEGLLIADVKEVLGQNVKHGTRRACEELRRPVYRYCINCKRIQRIMRQKELLRIIKHQKRYTTDSIHPFKRYPNLVKKLKIAHPDQVWAIDITYIRTSEGWLYLAGVFDLFSRKVVGWEMSSFIDADLVERALRMAIYQRQPAFGLLHHSGWGSRYANHHPRDILVANQVQISMSRRADCYDNAVMESFFGTLKNEWVHHQKYHTRSQARTDIFSYIEGFYNPVRLHS